MRYEPIWYGWDLLLLYSLFPFFNFNKKHTTHSEEKKNSRTNSFVTFCYFFNLFSSWLFFLSPTLHETLRLGCRSQTLPTHHYETRQTTNKNTKKIYMTNILVLNKKNYSPDILVMPELFRLHRWEIGSSWSGVVRSHFSPSLCSSSSTFIYATNKVWKIHHLTRDSQLLWTRWRSSSLYIGSKKKKSTGRNSFNSPPNSVLIFFFWHFGKVIPSFLKCATQGLVPYGHDHGW